MFMKQSRHSHAPANRAVGLILAALAGVWLAASPASASPVNYVFRSDASTTLTTDVEAISGSFTFDTATLLETSAFITLTGPGPYAGTYTDASEVSTRAFSVFAHDAGGLANLEISFQNNLNVSPDILLTVLLDNIDGTLNEAAGLASGAVIFAPVTTHTPTGVPEPASFAILGAALAGLGALRRRKKA